MTSTDITKSFCRAKTQLLYPVDFFADWPTEYLSTVEPIIWKLESFLNLKRTKVDIRAQFKEGKTADGKSLEDYLETVQKQPLFFVCFY